MKLQLAISQDNQIKLFLIESRKKISQMKWKDDNSLSRFLLFEINRILKKNKMTLDKISGFEIMSDVPRKWTTCRIAEITFKILAIAKKYSV